MRPADRIAAKWIGTSVVLAGLATAAWTMTAPETRQPGDDWRTFDASWSATGERHSLTVEQGRTAAIVRLSGALVLKTGEGLSRGFRAQAIGFDDGRGSGTGRAVWTDDQGDQIFSELSGPPALTGRTIVGSITGGTGRYSGVVGEYSLTWEYVMPSDDGRIQARAVAVTGRYRRRDSR